MRPALDRWPLAPSRSVRLTMLWVGVALLPGLSLSLLFFGPGVLRNVAACSVGALMMEALALRLRARPWTSLADGSALVTALLLALSLPPLLPPGLAFAGGAIAIGLGKQLFGGLGQNPFNPAMVAYVALLISFPEPMTRWPGELAASLASAWDGGPPGLDAATGATLLDRLRAGLAAARTVSEVVGDAGPGSLAATMIVGLGWLIGGSLLLALGVLRWQIPIGVLAGLLLPSFLAHALDPDRFAAASLQLFAGATLFGAFFIATDPVTAAATPRGRLLFGAGIGLLTWLIRGQGQYPDGFAFAVLLMNLCVPWIDRWTARAPRPRVVGLEQDSGRQASGSDRGTDHDSDGAP